MEKDPIFSELFQEKHYVGSSYENLKIDTPNEFDINFNLIIPKYIGELKVCNSPDPGFCRLYLDEETYPAKPEKDGVKKVVKGWFNGGYLRRSAVLNWMTSVIDKVFSQYHKLKVGNETFEIRRSYSGPAVTLTVKPLSEPEHTFSIDLVPVFLFSNWPDNVLNIRMWRDEMKYEEWCAVPKSKDENTETSFRMSFWSQEKQLLSDRNHLKPALKLIKKLRDLNHWKGLCSYHIKTIFLWRNDNCEKSYWSENSKSVVFMMMLTELQDYFLKEEKLPFYWNSRFDLWSKIKPETKEIFGNSIKKMREKIERNLDVPHYIEENYFLKSERNMVLAPVTDNMYMTPVTEEVAESGGGWLLPALVAGVVGLTAVAAITAEAEMSSRQREREEAERRQRALTPRSEESLVPLLTGGALLLTGVAAVTVAVQSSSRLPELPDASQLRSSQIRNDTEESTKDDENECSIM